MGPEFRLAYDVAAEEIRDRISGSQIHEEESGVFGTITAVYIARGIGKLSYSSQSRMLLVILSAPDGGTGQIGLKMDETAIKLEDNKVSLFSRLHQIPDSGESLDNWVISCTFEPSKIAYTASLINDSDEQTRRAIDFLDNRKSN